MTSNLLPNETVALTLPKRGWRRALMRVKYNYSMLVLLFFFLALTSSADSKSLNIGYLAFLIVIALAFAFSECRGLWMLKARLHQSRLDKILVVFAAIAVTSLIVLDYTKNFTLSGLYLSFPALLAFIALTCIAWISELRNSVFIYSDSSGYKFVPRTSGGSILNRVSTVLFFLLMGGIGFLLLSDESPDPSFDAFYAQSSTHVPDNLNAVIGILGLTAPSGTDYIAFGRIVKDALSDYSKSYKAQSVIDSKGTLHLTNYLPGELDCLNWPNNATSQLPCPTEDRLNKLLNENAELLNRYRQISLLPEYYSDGLGRNGGLFIELNKLIAEEVALELHSGNHESAYRKWRDNYMFLSRISRGQDTFIGKAILLVNEGISLTSIEYLLHDAPELIDSHADELIQLLKPVGLLRWNLEGTMRAEYGLFSPLLSGETKLWVHPNFIRNRFFHSAKVFLNTAEGRPSELESNFTEQQKLGDISTWTWDYMRDPMNTLFSRLLMGGQFKAGSLVGSMVQKDGRLRLLTLRILIAKNKIDDADVDSFLARQPMELRNPFTNKPMRWSTKRHLIWFCVPNHPDDCGQVRLKGGQWLDDPTKECG